MVLTTSPIVKALPVEPTIVFDHTYQFSMGPGGYFTTNSSLKDDIYGTYTGTGHVDKFIMKVIATTHIFFEVRDFMPWGDRICLYLSKTRKWCAVSPNWISLNGWVNQGTYTFYVGYDLPNAGVFPADYNIIVSGAP